MQHYVQRALVALSHHSLFLSLFLSTSPRLSLPLLWWQHAQCWSVTDPDPPRISHHTKDHSGTRVISFFDRVACVTNTSTLVTGVDSWSNFHSSFSPSSDRSCASSTPLHLSHSSLSLSSSLFPRFMLSPSNSHFARVLVYSWSSSGAPQAFPRAPSLLFSSFPPSLYLVLFLLFFPFSLFRCDFTAHSCLPGPQLLSSYFCAPPESSLSLSLSS